MHCPHCHGEISFSLDVPADSERRARAALIRRAAEEYGVRVALITSRDRAAQVHAARSVVAYVLRQRGMSYPRIGTLLDRDHSTVMSMVSRVERRMEASAAYALKVRRIAGAMLEVVERGEAAE
jgi:chromosomal replication initiation ATPase DnaA